jgi:hypothetical protein
VVERLRVKRRRASTRSDLSENTLDVLYGRGVLSEAERDAGLHLAKLLQIHRRARWLSPPTVSRLWRTLSAGGVDGTPAIGVTGDVRATIGDFAMRAISQIYHQLGREHYALAVGVLDDARLACVQSLIAADGVYGRDEGGELVLVKGEMAPTFDLVLRLISQAFARLETLQPGRRVVQG